MNVKKRDLRLAPTAAPATSIDAAQIREEIQIAVRKAIESERQAIRQIVREELALVIQPRVKWVFEPQFGPDFELKRITATPQERKT